MTEMTVLQPGDPFPSLTVALPGGRTLRLPDALAGRFGVVLYYRGSWCPYCNAQLSAFQRSLDNLSATGHGEQNLPAGKEAPVRLVTSGGRARSCRASRRPQAA